MRILLVHSFYGSSAPSGENRVVLEERDMLRNAGHEVVEHFTSSDAIRDHGALPVLRYAVLVPWNEAARNAIRQTIAEVAPDVMHVHNVFPMLSPAIFSAAEGTRTAVVNTLHNYRPLCPAAMPLREGVTCTRCIDTRSVYPALRYGCYRRSRLATIPVAAAVSLHRKLNTYARHVDAFIALTRFQKSVFANGGFPSDRIHVKPNCYAGVSNFVSWEERSDKAVFLGRISVEKGVEVLLRAWESWSDAPRLEVIGTGPDLERLSKSVSVNNSRKIIFTGSQSAAEARELLSRAKLLIVPSTWFEGFPLVLSEAFAFGVPIVASRLPTFEELVQTPGAGRLFSSGDPNDLRTIVSALWTEMDVLRQMSNLAYSEYQERYTASTNLAELENIYASAIETRRARLHASRLHHQTPVYHAHCK